MVENLLENIWNSKYQTKLDNLATELGYESTDELFNSEDQKDLAIYFKTETYLLHKFAEEHHTLIKLNKYQPSLN